MADSIDTIWTKQIGQVVKTVKFSPDGSKIYVGASNLKPFVLDSKTSEKIQEFEGINNTNTIDLSKDGSLLIACGDSDKVILYNTQNGNLVKQFQVPKSSWHNISYDFRTFLSASISFDNKLISVIRRGNDKATQNMGDVYIWDIESGSLIKDLGIDLAQKVRFSPTQNYLAVGQNKVVDIFDANTWQIYTTFTGHNDLIQDIDFSPDGSLLASCVLTDNLIIWEISSKQEISTIPRNISDPNYLTGFLSVKFINNINVIFGTANLIQNQLYLWDLIDNKKIINIPIFASDELDYNDMSKQIGIADYQSVTKLKINTTSVPINDEIIANIFPNPTNGQVTFNFNCNNPNQHYELYNSSGILLNNQLINVQTQGKFTISFATYPIGTFLLKLFCGSQFSTYKIVKVG